MPDPDNRTVPAPSDPERLDTRTRFTANRIGKQFVLDVRGVRREALQDVDAMDRLTQALAGACGAKVLEFCARGFEPTGGLTALAILSSSHVALHTWPEFGYLAVDLFCCSTDVDPHAIAEALGELGGGELTVTSSSFARPLVAHEAGDN
jgi:S-adenosylmethionine decarboxylase